MFHSKFNSIKVNPTFFISLKMCIVIFKLKREVMEQYKKITREKQFFLHKIGQIL